MKGNISIGDFIKEVKMELMEAREEREKAFYELKEVNLEITFALDASAKAGGKLFVVEIGGETKASQTHRINLKLEPIPRIEVEDQPSDEVPPKDESYRAYRPDAVYTHPSYTHPSYHGELTAFRPYPGPGTYFTPYSIGPFKAPFGHGGGNFYI